MSTACILVFRLLRPLPSWPKEEDDDPDMTRHPAPWSAFLTRPPEGGTPNNSCFPSLFHKQRQRRREPVQEAAFADRTNFTIAKKAGQPDWAKALLNELSVMIGTAEHSLAASIATAQTAPIYRSFAQGRARARQEFVHVFGRRGGRAALELDGLAQSWSSPDGDAARPRVGAQQVPNQEISAMKLFEIFIDDQTDEEIAARAFLLLGGQLIEGLGQDFIGGPIADLVNDVLVDFRQRPGFSNRRAALRSDPDQPHLAAERDGHPTFLENVTIEINLGGLLAKLAAG